MDVWIGRGSVRGRDTWPVTSFEGAIGVLLYGIVGGRGGRAAKRWVLRGRKARSERVCDGVNISRSPKWQL